MLWKCCGRIISKKKLWCRKRRKKKSGKLFCGNGIAEREGKKNNLPLFIFYFYPSISAPQFFLEMIRLQYFHNIFTTNLKWQVVTDYYYWGKKVILVLDSNLNQ